MLNLDTHILILHLAGELDSAELRCLAGKELAISDIVLWELAKLIKMRRLVLDLDSPVFRSFLRTLTVIPITLEIARQSTRLDFSSDPADEIIAATSVVKDLPLLTRDQRIRKSRLVPFAL
jgi:PIN domain nuclease of toxin-antitoxin system